MMNEEGIELGSEAGRGIKMRAAPMRSISKKKASEAGGGQGGEWVGSVGLIQACESGCTC